MSEFEFYDADDWVALYRNGKLVDQGHEIPYWIWMRTLNGEFHATDKVMEYASQYGGFPDNLEELKEALDEL